LKKKDFSCLDTAVRSIDIS